ncbi:POT family proton-dependent oligopeptide transporter [Kordia periserrulae]|uniref:POT family proton-dependent oligopeptide transporter n=1 Tax=Kordia periserrulae TaxID=701523 RepID=A0A2T6BSW5_9FLAO|nr:peptide MFS transporter [Kordia periserrulae]PTX59181.1 POT family proton-dependent oligopeptide transporter [Kordia periserrulae]
MKTSTENFFDTKVMGHPAGLFVLFFTEMWERFSYYGMRVLLVFFFTASVLDQGWGWPKEHALAIFGTYASLVYLSTMIGGYFADKVIGFRWAVVIGALLMTLGHGAMALETPFFIYLGLTLLVFGSGFFKPNMTSIISEMYKDRPEKKDGAYTIFYMGVNAGAFFGIMICGYLGEKIGWSYGFGVAGIFMLFGLLQFWFSQNIFGDIGLKPKKENKDDVEVYSEANGGPRNPFTVGQQVIIALCVILGLTWILNEPISKITEGEYNIYNFEFLGLDGNTFIILLALVLFIALLVIRIPKYIPVVRDRMLAIVFFAFITMFFWALFEQAPGSLNLYARDYTQRVLEGVSGDIFKIVDALITIIPLAIITYVLVRLFQKTFKKYALANIILAFSFVIIWGLAVMKVYNDYKSASYKVEYVDNNGNIKTEKIVTFTEFKEGDQMPILDNESISIYDATAKENKKNVIKNNYLLNEKEKEQGEIFTAEITKLSQRDKIGAGITNTFATFSFTNPAGKSITKEVKLTGEMKKLKVGDSKQILIEHNVKYDNQGKKQATAMVKARESAVEIGATWFNILNSLFIIALAPLFSKWWESKYNPTANGKYAVGMALLGLGMLVVAVGSAGIEPGQDSATTSMFILVFVYLFHTMGELCVSPVALSYVSKLVPGRMIAMMFGLWYIAVAIGMKMAGIFGEMSEGIAKEQGVSTFFWYLTGIAVILSLLAWITTPIVKKLMHGVK